MTEPGSLPVVAVVGATATGKTALGVALSLRLGGEVVNADAMQLYRGMDIGTAKATPAERRGIPHHLIDVLEVTQEASVAAYQRDAREAIGRIRAAGRVPIVVGGSGLYVRAALDVLDIPPTDPSVRARLEQEYAEVGLEPLRARLRALDPAAEGAIVAGNARRVIRALEVVELTGEPFSARMPERAYVADTVAIGLRLERPRLDVRIDARAEAMFAAGLVAEVEALLPLGLRGGRTAARALGYAQALGVLDGVLSCSDAVAQTAQLTRRFARRQESWFRADPRVTWYDAQSVTLVEDAVELVRRGGRQGPGSGTMAP
jgi:tRNA dimethylallyltransferase